MELRLIHGLAYRCPWFSRWGYKFTHGTYGVTLQIYQTSLDALRTLPLFVLVPHFIYIAPKLPTIVAKYQTVSGGTHNLLTLSDLFLFMTELNHRLPANSPFTFDYHSLIMEPTCRWSKKRVEMAAQVIVSALKKSEVRWVTRQEVRDAARAYIGDTGLLDYVLKSLGNHIVGSYIVRRMVNPITKVLEYCLQDISNQFGSVRFQLTRMQLMRDMFYVYKHVLMARSSMVVNGVRAILDAKHLVKDYTVSSLQVESQQEDCLKIMCTVSVVHMHEGQMKHELTEYEIVQLQPNATVGELKKQVESKFREVYLGLQGFTAERVAGVDAKDTDYIVGVIDSGSRVIVEGRVSCQDEIVYEGGGGDRVVECRCGAKEDDGEQMVSCDICEVWQHTRCAGVEDEEERVPPVFLCSQCEDNIAALPSIQY